MRTKKQLREDVSHLAGELDAALQALEVAEAMLRSFQAHDRELHERIDFLERAQGGKGGHGGQYL